MQNDLKTIAQAMVLPGKGILAADESTGTIEKRFAKINLPSTEENRRAYRDLLFTTPGLGMHISGVILYDETIRQSTADGKTFIEVFQGEGVLPGIKVDEGTKAFGDRPEEKVTKGLEGLPKRMPEYAKMGAKFAKWRAIYSIGDGLPSDSAVRENAKRLAAYAKICQGSGIVPIVEPEVLMDGAHTIDACRKATERVLAAVFEELKSANVAIEGMILKPNMVVPGKESGASASPGEVADATLAVLAKVLPHDLPGVAFLSGGQSEREATENLNAMNEQGPHPWRLTFSYGRALQDSALKLWNGREENIPAAQKALYHRAKMNGLATLGKYRKDMERELQQ